MLDSHPRHGNAGHYRYRGARKPDPSAVQAEKVRKLLRDGWRRMSFNSSSMRALSVRLNQQIAQALCDGMKQTKAALEGRRLKLLAAARRLGVLDDYELAALSGLQRETIRKMTWGLQPESGAIPA